MFRRPAARTVRWTFAGVCLVAAGITAVTLTWPWTAGTAPKQLAAPFTDHDGVIVFEEQPSGELGTARPDGSGAEPLGNLGTLQGYDLPVVSPDDRFMANEEGQVVALGPAGALSVTFSAAVAQLRSSESDLQNLSFADGDKFLTMADCDGNIASPWRIGFASSSPNGTGELAGPVDLNDAQAVAGDPQSEGVFAVPGPSSADCNASSLQIPAHGDSGVVLYSPKQAPRTVVTATTLTQTLGAAHSTPVLLSVYPSPDGSLLAVTVDSFTIIHSQGSTYPDDTILGTVVVTRSGQVKLKLPGFGDGMFSWSADGKRIATITSSRTTPWIAGVWTLTGGLERITMTGHDKQFPDQLLWSPDGTQLIISWDKDVTNALTEADYLVQGWTVLDLHTKQVQDVTAPGQPAAWLPGQGGAR